MTRKPSHSEPAAEADWLPWPARWRGLASGLIVFHVFAVFIAPLSGPGPSSELARDTAALVSPYTNAVAINNGYRFFAPDPGPSNLTYYEIESQDGSIQTGMFPDPHQHWPRLLYHRYFMLAETIAATSPVLRDPPAEELRTWSEEQRQMFARDQRGFRELLRAVASDLAAERDDVAKVRIAVRTHEIPTPDHVAGGIRLDDDKLYVQRPLMEFSRDDL